MITELLDKWSAKVIKPAELGSLSRKWFPNAVDQRTNTRRDFTLFYDTRVSISDVADLIYVVDHGKSVHTTARNIPLRFVPDFLYKGSRLNLILDSPRESDVFRLLTDNPKNFVLTAMLKGNAGYWQVRDLKHVAEEAKKRGNNALLYVCVVGNYMSVSRITDIENAGGRAVWKYKGI